jgi:hypothetical protein
MASITSWNRLEPRTRSATLPGVQARLHDPLWLLARQWQFGEFLAEDAGSPVAVRVNGAWSSIAGYQAGAVVAELGATPLETMVQREPVTPALRDRVNAGLYFLRLLGSGLAQRVSGWYGEHFMVGEADGPPAGPGRLLSRLAVKRTPDGTALWTAIRDGGVVVPPGMNPDDLTLIQAALATFRGWYEAEYGGGPDSAWQPESLRYGFEVNAPLGSDAAAAGGTVLTASFTGQGRLDWYAFDAEATANRPAGTVSTLDVTAVPVPVSFAGMPSPRWWEFEDGTVDFGAIDTGPEDLGRLLLAEFALVYGNDFFMVPLELPVGALCRISSLEVSNTFGENVVIPQDAPGQAGSWRLFRLSQPQRGGGPAPGTDLFFLPPSPGWTIEGPPIEEISLLRDEMANLAWAVEQLVEADAGPVNRAEQENLSRAPAPPDPAPEATGASPVLEYRLATPVPSNWYALVPEQQPAAAGASPRAVAFRLAGGSAPEGRILAELAAVRLHEEELGRSGAVLRRNWKYARWIDGSTHVWVGRVRTLGRGEGSSGLRFDELIAQSQA